MRTENQRQIIECLGEEIFTQSFQCASEQYAPRREADAMDEYIQQRQANVKELRRIREVLEDLFTGRLL